MGGFKDTPIDDLVVAVLKETLKRTGVKPEASTGKGWGGVGCHPEAGCHDASSTRQHCSVRV